jgi:hypothetical protein
MISRPSTVWQMLARILDRFIAELNDDDLCDLYERVQVERQKRWLASRGSHLMPCIDCGFVSCQCSPE